MSTVTHCDDNKRDYTKVTQKGVDKKGKAVYDREKVKCPSSLSCMDYRHGKIQCGKFFEEDYTWSAIEVCVGPGPGAIMRLEEFTHKTSRDKHYRRLLTVESECSPDRPCVEQPEDGTAHCAGAPAKPPTDPAEPLDPSRLYYTDFIERCDEKGFNIMKQTRYIHKTTAEIKLGSSVLFLECSSPKPRCHNRDERWAYCDR